MIVRLPRAALELGGYSPRYVQNIASDRYRPEHLRNYPPSVHARFPLFAKDGRSWVITRRALDEFIRERIKQFEPDV